MESNVAQTNNFQCLSVIVIVPPTNVKKVIKGILISKCSKTPGYSFLISTEKVYSRSTFNIVKLAISVFLKVDLFWNLLQQSSILKSIQLMGKYVFLKTLAVLQ